MKLLKGIADTVGYLTEGALEIFSPNHDASPPEIGTQPYSGEAYHPTRKHGPQVFLSSQPRRIDQS